MQPVSRSPAIGENRAARACYTNQISHPCTFRLTVAAGALMRLQDWILLYHLADPV
jgi:hypothetical protein